MSAKESSELFQLSWSAAWQSSAYRAKFLTAAVLFAGVLMCFPYFFEFIQEREGVVLNHWLLAILPSVDMSVYIFAVIYMVICLGIFRAAQSPKLFLIFLWASLLLSVSRIITITLVPLDPPEGLVTLTDPVLLPFYGESEITKDLFYSGHTGSVFLIYLTLKKKWEKVFALCATILVAIMLLLQHIHYMLDILAAPVFVYIVYFIARKICNVSPDE